MNRIIFFSGGKASFSVADYVKHKYPNDNIVLYFTDTNWEDDDLYRFIYEASDKLQLPLLYHSMNVNPLELMVKQRFMYNSRVGNCSRILKMKVASDYLKKGIVPTIEKWHNKQFLKDDDFVKDAILYFGIGFDEMHRQNAIRENWKPFKVEMPLIDNIIDNDQVLSKYNIKQPKLYDMGFSHNNCKGRCVKAGKGHFRNLLEQDRELFIELMNQEIILSEYIRYTKQQTKYDESKDHLKKDVLNYLIHGIVSYKINHILMKYKYTKNWVIGNTNKPYSFIKNCELEEIYKQPQQCSLFDIGGCGCFVDYE